MEQDRSKSKMFALNKSFSKTMVVHGKEIQRQSLQFQHALK
jgi:hypothetical protein